LSSPQSGTIAQVLVNEGDRVASGQVLARLDVSQLEAQLAANVAAVAQSEARLRSSAVQAPISSQQYKSAVTLGRTEFATGAKSRRDRRRGVEEREARLR
jgi:multidrug efflux pump subunit AcrA (membrane-fusion protein)